MKKTKILNTKKKRIIFILVLIIAISLLYLFFFYYYHLMVGVPVLFLEDNNIKIGLWPNATRAALVFTIDDIDSTTNIWDLSKVMEYLNDGNIKSTFFVIPYTENRYKMTKNSQIANYLLELVEQGNEVAQHGLTHRSLRSSISKLDYNEFKGLPYFEQKRRILIGKKILEDAGFNISGFRAPTFGITKDTFNILEDLKFDYDSDIRISPWILMSNKPYAQSIFYPFHIKELNLIEFVVNGDFFWETKFTSKINKNDFNILKRRFNIYYEKEGCFVILSHIQKLNTKKSLSLLKEFSDYQKNKNLWRTNLKEVSDWWKIRENLYAETYIENDTLKIFIESPFNNLEGLTIYLKNPEIKSYEIYVNSNLVKKGKTIEKIIL